MPRVLVIEDLTEWQTKYRQDLPATVEIVPVTTLAGATTVVNQILAHTVPDFDVIVVDGSLHESGDTVLLAKRLGEAGYGARMIAGSNSIDSNFDLRVISGCEHEARKDQVVDKIREILGI
ncbi:MAG: hypothetical protein HYT15_01125 [Candidatus Magasanikbacteria bacterium]|nr:hypothetical protein [Candidatus Magasanikbacteria bacterium]